MSEFQYYEFRAVDRPLMPKEIAALKALSSRAVVTSHSASYVYDFGEFRGNLEEVLEAYFDAALYITNWGTRQVLFRFPKAALDIEALRPYEVEDMIVLKHTQDYVTLNLCVAKEEGEWVEEGEEDRLPSLMPLREAILAGDMRALYLMWLRCCDHQLVMKKVKRNNTVTFIARDDDDLWGDLASTTLEPPVPPNLGKLDAALDAFVEFFEIEKAFIEAGAVNSDVDSKRASEDVAAWITQLTEAEAKAHLTAILRGDPGAVNIVKRELRQRFGERPSTSATPRRSIAQLFEEAGRAATRRLHAKQKRAEEQRLKHLEEVAKNEQKLWVQIEAKKTSKSARLYDEVVAHLVDLRDLALHRDTEDGFNAKFAAFVATLTPQSALRTRLKNAGFDA